MAYKTFATKDEADAERDRTKPPGSPDPAVTHRLSVVQMGEQFGIGLEIAAPYNRLNVLKGYQYTLLSEGWSMVRTTIWHIEPYETMIMFIKDE